MLRKSQFVLARGIRQNRGGATAVGPAGLTGTFGKGGYDPSQDGPALSGANSKAMMKEQSQTLEGVKERAMRDGAGELGLTPEEFAARKVRASTPYKIKRDKGGEISILSSARASQIMTEGAVERTSNRTTAEISKRDRNLRYFNYFMVTTGLSGAAFVFLAFIWPVLQMRNRRYLQQKRRHEEFFLPALEKLEREREQERQMVDAARKAGVTLKTSGAIEAADAEMKSS